MKKITNIDRFLMCRTIAFVGATPNKKLGNIFYINMKKKGFHVIPVNPNYQQIENDICYPTISQLPEKPEGVLIFTPKRVTESIVDEAIKSGIHNIWIQLESDTPCAVQKAKEANINLVYGKCIMMFAEPVKGIHKFHRFINNLLLRNR